VCISRSLLAEIPQALPLEIVRIVGRSVVGIAAVVQKLVIENGCKTVAALACEGVRRKPNAPAPGRCDTALVRRDVTDVDERQIEATEHRVEAVAGDASSLAARTTGATLVDLVS
jgi:hypothetical protein